jgi:hypothetical protein
MLSLQKGRNGFMNLLVQSRHALLLPFFGSLISSRLDGSRLGEYAFVFAIFSCRELVVVSQQYAKI